MNRYLISVVEKWWLPCLILLIAACQKKADENVVSNVNRFADPVLVQISQYQDLRNTGQLLQYFKDQNPAYREAAAEAFGSVQDSLAIPLLSTLLNDQHAKVRRAAAYALGQTFDSSAIKPLSMALDAEDSLYVRRELYEALGKVITQPRLAWLNTRPAEQPEEKEGLAWGLYRAGIRNVHDQVSTGTAVALLAAENNYRTRLGAAHFLARTQQLSLKAYLPQLIQSAVSDSAADVRMAITTVLGKIEAPSAYETLVTTSLKDRDYRVRINALRALSVVPFERMRGSIYAALEDENVNVSVTAAELISNKESSADSILQHAAQVSHLRARGLLYGGAIKLKGKSVGEKIKKEFEEATNPYYKADLLTALGSDITHYEFIVTGVFNSDHPAIATAGANVLVNFRKGDQFPDELTAAFDDIFKELILTGDVALVSIVAELLSDPAYHFREAYSDHSFLEKAKGMLSLPKDNEALQPLNKAIALFEGSEDIPETVNEYNNPIDWDLVKQIPNRQQVKVTTTKGSIILELLVDEAPGSVANFYKLVKQGYFTNKNFHRVVPNFVIQGGCNRGDGYGSEDYSIRSEFANRRYSTGSVGMASAGKDTEGTQWFITHSPTPHLDGRYTIFAQVSEGIDVVHAIEVGDTIQSVEIL